MSNKLYKELIKMREYLKAKFEEEYICSDYMLKKLSIKRPMDLSGFKIPYWYRRYFLAVINKSRPCSASMAESKIYFDFDLPYKLVYHGYNVDAYAKNSRSKPYICSCQKDAIINKIKLYEEIYQYDYQIKDRDELLLEHFGLPRCFENKIIASMTPWSEKWLDYIDFKDNLCPICNNIKARELKVYFNNGVSRFRQKYAEEIDRRFNSYGVGSNLVQIYGYCWQYDRLPDNLKPILNTDKEELTKLLLEKGYSSIKIEKNLSKFYKLPKEMQDNLMFARHFSKSGHFIEYEYLLKIKASREFQDFIEDIQSIIHEKYKACKKLIMDEIKTFDKNAREPKKIYNIRYMKFELGTGKRVDIEIDYRKIKLIEQVKSKNPKLLGLTEDRLVAEYKYELDTYAEIISLFDEKEIRKRQREGCLRKFKCGLITRAYDGYYTETNLSKGLNDVLEYLDKNIFINGEPRKILFRKTKTKYSDINNDEENENDNKYYYLTVEYEDIPEKQYNYISTDRSIRVGDKVLVDRTGKLAIARVVEAQLYDEDKVPYPVHLTKNIRGKFEDQWNMEYID